MKRKQKQKIRLILNMALMVFTLFALIVSMVAWFSANKTASINGLNLFVNQKEFSILKQPESYMFYCATKIAEVDKDLFNSECCVVGEYYIEGADMLYADVVSDQDVLGYVLTGDEKSTDYYDIITNALKEELNVDTLSDVSYNDLRSALRDINLSHTAGVPDKVVTADGIEHDAMKIQIVCWTEYEQYEENFMNGSGDIYKSEDLSVKVRFIS